ncbi:hypothetical protein ACOMHN_042834 [Nucella lapillus]
MNVRLVKGSRRGKILVIDGFIYQRHKSSGALLHWRCWRETCRAKVKTNIFDVDNPQPRIRVVKRNDHNHPDDSAMTEAISFRQQLQEVAAADPTRPSRRIYNTQVAQIHRAQGGGDRPQLPSYLSVRASLQRTRNANIPAIPRNVAGVAIDGPWAQTWLQDRLLQNLDNYWGIAVFATEENLLKLRDCRVIYLDGTFKVCPRPYQQVFEVFGELQGHVVPFVHVLMEHRTTGHYRQVFQFLKTTIRRLTHHNWRPHTVICDFEQALHSAVETELPRTAISACYFHFCQSLWRKIQELGLSAPYRQNQQLKTLLRKIMALGYLPLQLLRMNFTQLFNARRTTRLMNRFPALQDFLQYVRNMYVRQGSFFPPAIWNVYQRDMTQRTNNKAEAYHRAFGETVQVRHPSLLTYIWHLKDQQARAEQQMTAAANGEAPPSRRRKWRQLEQRIVRLKNQFINGNRNLEEYWSAVAHCICHFQ